MNVNDLIAPIISLWNERIGTTGLQPEQSDLVICCLEVFEAALKKEGISIVTNPISELPAESGESKFGY